jgi:PAS domain S-box-containing protein
MIYKSNLQNKFMQLNKGFWQDLQVFSLAIETTSDAVIIGDLTGKITYVNNAALKICGATNKADILGKHVIEFIAEQDRQRVTQSSLNSLKTGKSFEGEYAALTMTGVEFPVEVTLSVMKDETGKGIGFIDVVRDITQRKKAEDKLRENEARFRSLYENSYDAVLLTVPNGRILSANPTACNMFGMSEAEIKKAGRAGLVIIDERANRAIQERAKIGKAQAELTFKRKDGSTFEGEATSSIFLDAEGSPKSSMIIRDITKRKKGEEALKQSEEKYRQLFTNMMDGFAYCQMIFDEKDKPTDFIYLEVNDAFERLTGLKRADVVGKKVSEAIPGTKEEHPELIEAYGKVASTGLSDRFEIEFKPLNFWLSISVYCPNTGYFAAVFENITEKKLLEKRLEEYSYGLELTVSERTKQLLQAQEQLLKSERLAAIGKLAGMVGHDLRNPLAAIKTASYLLRKKQGAMTTENANEILTTIDRAVEKANNIIGDLLDYSREMNLDLQEYSPKSLIDYTLLSMTIPNTVKIVDHTQSFPTIWVDASKMERVFVNLAKNALEAMPNGGTLEIASYQNAEDLDFTFSDTGKGMPDNVLEKLFTPLFTTKPIGMGLGLPICKRIVEAHGGKITVQSTPNKGTTFTIKLPTQPHKTKN